MRISTWFVVILALAATCLIVSFIVWPEFPRFVERSGVNVPADDVYLDYVKGVGWAAFLSALIFMWPVRLSDRIMLFVMWVIRCAVMFIIMLPYEEHYVGLDCWVYFNGAHSAGANPLDAILKGGNDFVMLLGALHLGVGPDSYHAMKASSGYAGLAAIYILYRAAVALAKAERRWMFWVLGLYPSTLFWSSILGKDPVVLLGIALHVWALIQVISFSKHKHLFTAIAGIGLASVVRVWMGPILLVPALLLFALRIRHVGWRVATVSIVICLLVVLAPATANRLSIDPSADLFASTQSFTRGWDKANSALHPDMELNSLTDLILFTPQSVFAAYFRPLPGDLPHFLGEVAGTEDLILLCLSVWAVLKIRRQYWSNHFFLWAVALLISWGLAYSLVTYKDLGTAVRFRLQIMPVLLAMVWFLISLPARFAQDARLAAYA